jgi:hypothetical protein
MTQLQEAGISPLAVNAGPGSSLDLSARQSKQFDKGAGKV